MKLVDYPSVTVRWWAKTPPRKIGAGYNKLGAMLNGLGEAGMLRDGEMEYDDLIGLRVAVTIHSTGRDERRAGSASRAESARDRAAQEAQGGRATATPNGKSRGRRSRKTTSTQPTIFSSRRTMSRLPHARLFAVVAPLDSSWRHLVRVDANSWAPTARTNGSMAPGRPSWTR